MNDYISGTTICWRHFSFLSAHQGLVYGRTVAVVYCEHANVNEAILDNVLGDIYENFRDVSEFADTNWAQEHSCSNTSNVVIKTL
jgi:hypothetical protein